MNSTVEFQKVEEESIKSYIKVGKQSYREHYLHLWKHRDPTSYITKSFTEKVVLEELANDNIANFLVKVDDNAAGIVKLVIDQPLDGFSSKDALLAEKIYLLKAFSGMGLGKKILQWIEDYARKRNKKVVWLDTMKKGKPLKFYLKHGYSIIKESQLNLPGALTSEKPMWVLTKEL